MHELWSIDPVTVGRSYSTADNVINTFNKTSMNGPPRSGKNSWHSQFWPGGIQDGCRAREIGLESIH